VGQCNVSRAPAEARGDATASWKDANGQQLAYLYFEDEAAHIDETAHARRGVPNRGEHRKAASVPRQILKDIPRPPVTASRDD
jgi:hypothetical protein